MARADPRPGRRAGPRQPRARPRASWPRPGASPTTSQVLAAIEVRRARGARGRSPRPGSACSGENRAQDLAAKAARSAPSAGSPGTSSATCSPQGQPGAAARALDPLRGQRLGPRAAGPARHAPRPRCSSRSTWPATRTRAASRRTSSTPSSRACPCRVAGLMTMPPAAERPGGQPPPLRRPARSSPPTAACPSSPWARRRTSRVAAEEGATVVRLGSDLVPVIAGLSARDGVAFARWPSVTPGTVRSCTSAWPRTATPTRRTTRLRARGPARGALPRAARTSAACGNRRRGDDFDDIFADDEPPGRPTTSLRPVARRRAATAATACACTS